MQLVYAACKERGRDRKVKLEKGDVECGMDEGICVREVPERRRAAVMLLSLHVGSAGSQP